jgi:hypothetical protein
LVNAAERAIGVVSATKIAGVISLFKQQFPDAKSDLKPWQDDPETRECVDPDSIDIGFHLPGWSRRFQCRSILVQIRFFEPEDQPQKILGLEIVGFDHQGQAWKLSTVDQWHCEGRVDPHGDIITKLQTFARQVWELFNSSPNRIDH